jgi:hypothetical protein
MRYTVGPMSRLWVLTGLAFVALLGADAASAAERSQHGADASAVRSDAAVGAGRLAPPVASQAPARPRRRQSRRVTTSTVKRFIRRQATIVGKGQRAVFPGARISEREVDPDTVYCSRLSSDAKGRPRWTCDYIIWLYETNRANPDQWTLRYCTTFASTGWVTVRRARSSRRLRIVGGWRMSCPVDESDISRWNDRGPDWQPNVTEPTPYEQAPVAQLGEPRGANLLAAPSGAPGGAPPGPLSAPQSSGSASRVAHSAQKDIFKGCSDWFRWDRNPAYWVYNCYWNPRPLPGLMPGILGSTSFYESYYWVGNDVYGRALSRFFQAGYLPYAYL